jgi:hypothetical protein
MASAGAPKVSMEPEPDAGTSAICGPSCRRLWVRSLRVRGVARQRPTSQDGGSLRSFLAAVLICVRPSIFLALEQCLPSWLACRNRRVAVVSRTTTRERWRYRHPVVTEPSPAGRGDAARPLHDATAPIGPPPSGRPGSRRRDRSRRGAGPEPPRFPVQLPVNRCPLDPGSEPSIRPAHALPAVRSPTASPSDLYVTTHPASDLLQRILRWSVGAWPAPASIS